jgi:hypothetical protein
MDLRQFTTFRILARTLSFTRTAAELNYVQSNVSAQIHSLERELGVRLFDRLGTVSSTMQTVSSRWSRRRIRLWPRPTKWQGPSS